MATGIIKVTVLAMLVCSPWLSEASSDESHEASTCVDDKECHGKNVRKSGVAMLQHKKTNYFPTGWRKPGCNWWCYRQWEKPWSKKCEMVRCGSCDTCTPAPPTPLPTTPSPTTLSPTPPLTPVPSIYKVEGFEPESVYEGVCAESALLTKEECESYAESIGYTFYGDIRNALNPKGCFRFDEGWGSGRVRFNSIETTYECGPHGMWDTKVCICKA